MQSTLNNFLFFFSEQLLGLVLFERIIRWLPLFVYKLTALVNIELSVLAYKALFQWFGVVGEGYLLWPHLLNFYFLSNKKLNIQFN